MMVALPTLSHCDLQQLQALPITLAKWPWQFISSHLAMQENERAALSGAPMEEEGEEPQKPQGSLVFAFIALLVYVPVPEPGIVEVGRMC